MFNPYFIEDKTKAQKLPWGHTLTKKGIRGAPRQQHTFLISPQGYSDSPALCHSIIWRIWTVSMSHRASYSILLAYSTDHIMATEPNEPEKASAWEGFLGRRKEMIPMKIQVPHNISKVFQNRMDWGMLGYPLQSWEQIICILSTPKKEAHCLVNPLITWGSLWQRGSRQEWSHHKGGSDGPGHRKDAGLLLGDVGQCVLYRDDLFGHLLVSPCPSAIAREDHSTRDSDPQKWRSGSFYWQTTWSMLLVSQWRWPGEHGGENGVHCKF